MPNALPAEHKTVAVRRDVDWLVRFETWDDRGQPLEFANFTDEEITDAILKVYQGDSNIPRERLLYQVKAERANPKRKNIEKLWESWREPQPDKMSVAEALWPTLENKIREAMSRDAIDEVPIARLVKEAYVLAAGAHRYDVMTGGAD